MLRAASSARKRFAMAGGAGASIAAAAALVSCEADPKPESAHGA